jgi:Family of unknown function (DUF6533)
MRLRATVTLSTASGASLILVLYDWLLTLGDEVELIIPTPWTVVKVLHTMVRSEPRYTLTKAYSGRYGS